MCVFNKLRKNLLLMNENNAVFQKYIGVSEKQITSIFIFYLKKNNFFPSEMSTDIYHTTRRHVTEASCLWLALVIFGQFWLALVSFIVNFLQGNSPASGLYTPYINQTPGNCPKGNLLYSVHGESLKSVGQFCLALVSFGQLWSVLVSFGQLWLVLVSFGQLCLSLVSFGQLWLSLVSFVQLWLVLVSFGQFWLALVIFGQFWLALVSFVYLWLALVIFGQFWLALVSFGYLWLVLVSFGQFCLSLVSFCYLARISNPVRKENFFRDSFFYF